MGKCFIWWGKFGDVAGPMGLGFRLLKRVFEDIVVAVWSRSLVDNGSRDVLVHCWGEEQYLLA